uniref:Transmembrane protein 183B n=1 Tax=Heterorhabditis bacteriophora TaxID=37862 RepID=A0A1I7WVF8_HETBA
MAPVNVAECDVEAGVSQQADVTVLTKKIDHSQFLDTSFLDLPFEVQCHIFRQNYLHNYNSDVQKIYSAENSDCPWFVQSYFNKFPTKAAYQLGEFLSSFCTLSFVAVAFVLCKCFFVSFKSQYSISLIVRYEIFPVKLPVQQGVLLDAVVKRPEYHWSLPFLRRRPISRELQNTVYQKMSLNGTLSPENS